MSKSYWQAFASEFIQKLDCSEIEIVTKFGNRTAKKTPFHNKIAREIDRTYLPAQTASKIETLFVPCCDTYC